MKILFLGDVVARAGRETVKKILPGVISEHSPNAVLANAENLSHGNGFTPDKIEELRKVGVTYFCSGDHTWGNKAGVTKLNDPSFPVIRPANYPPENVPGRGYAIFEDNMMNKILFINLLGRVFMKRDYDCPFRAVDQILKDTSYEKFSAIIVDLHAEATSEKYAMSFFLDGRVSAVIGTHTHVPTMDARILENGTAALSDAGMVGSYDSVIGVQKDGVINSFITQMPLRHNPENEGKMVFNAVLLEIDEKTMKTVKISQIQKII